MGSASDFVAHFEDLAGQVTNLDPITLEGIFLNGLRGALRATVEMMKPTTLAEMKAYALSFDTKHLTKLLAKEMQAEHRYQRNYQPTTFRPREPSPTPVQTDQALPRPQSKTRYINDKEMEERKRLGLCFKYDSRWSKDHYKVCSKRTLQLLTVINGCDMELLDRTADTTFQPTEEDTFEECEDQQATVAQLSFNSFLGINTPSTTKIRVQLGAIQVVALVDSGATHNFVSPDTVNHLKLQVVHESNIKVFLGTGITAPGLGICKDASFHVAPGVTFNEDFIILELGDADIILGVQWLSKLGTCHCNWNTNEFSFLHHEEVVQLWGEKNLSKTLLNGHVCSGKSRRLPSGVLVSFHAQSLTGHTISDPSIQRVVENFTAVFAAPTSLPPIRNREHTIQLQPGTKAISARPYRYPHAYKTIIEDMVADMLASGLIRQSKSPFSSPVLLVRKKDKSWRFCVDYRALNRVTIPDKFPIPIIDQLLDELKGAAVFSKLDLRAGYHQIRMAEEDIHKTAFRTHEGHYEFCVMPFGLMNAPATFQALMNELFRPYLRKFVLIFFDDILVFSSDPATHQEHLTTVLTVLANQSLFANASKCIFAQPQIDYLGHIISINGVATDPEKTRAVLQWPPPKCIRGLRGFLGLTGYYRRFVKHYGELARPLTQLLKKDSFAWSPEAQTAFDNLKQAMCQVPVLQLPDFTALFTVETDASNTGLGTVLQQHRRPIAYFSYSLTPRERMKSTYERELMAIVMAVNKWRHYLLGRHFVVATDQQSLKHLLEQKEISGDYQRWLLKLLRFDFEIRYKPGSTNHAADSLSRNSPGAHDPSTSSQVHSAVNTLLARTFPVSLDMHELLEEAAKDPYLTEIRQAVLRKKPPRLGYHLRGNQLWFKSRLVIPKSSAFIQLFLTECHAELTGGHAGVLKTSKKVKQFVHWEGMKQDIQRFVAECVVCQTHKSSTLAPGGLLQPLPIPKAIWEDISLDFVEGLPLSLGANSILVVTDRLSKFAHFIALRHPYTAADVAQKFATEIVRLHGMPATIVSDRDRIFLSSFWKNLFKLAGTKLKYSSAYHPETDGQTEVLNRSLECYLRCFTSAKPSSWNKFLSWAELWYNSSYHTSIKTTPFRVVYGRDPPPLCCVLNQDRQTTSRSNRLCANATTHYRS